MTSFYFSPKYDILKKKIQSNPLKSIPMTYYGVNQISIEKLTYEEFRKYALDLPDSLKPNYADLRSGSKTMNSPYADGLGGWNQGSNFMPQLCRELVYLRKKDPALMLSYQKKLQKFAQRILDESEIPDELEFQFKYWKERLDSAHED